MQKIILIGATTNSSNHGCMAFIFGTLNQKYANVEIITFDLFKTEKENYIFNSLTDKIISAEPS